jgi:hypothetical protein
MRKLGFFVIFVSFFLFAGCASATTYYIDIAGNDANSGTSKTTPWMHVPGMQGCTGVCASASPNAGDRFILKGGATWPNSTFPIQWSWSGTNGNNIYIGVDQTWFTGGSWTRPIFDAGGTPISGTYDMFIHALSQSNVTWDNIEMKGLNWQKTYGYASMACGVFAGGTNVLLSNWYVHGWSHTGGATTDEFDCVIGDTNAPYMSGSLIDHMVFDGFDSTNGGDSGGATYSWPQVTNSIIANCTNGILLTGHGDVGNNLIYNINQDFDTTVHENAIESNESDGTTYIHDNVIHNVNYGEASFLGGNSPSQIIYSWNNVYFNLDNANPIHIEDRNSSWTGYFFNNTIVPKAGLPCFLQVGSSAAATIVLENTNCISSGGLDNFTSPISATRNTNLLQTLAVVLGLGGTSTETYAYSLTSIAGSILSPGTNASSVWPSGFSTNDTSYACTETAGSGGKVSTCPSRTVNSRTSTGAWDVGAYSYSGTTVSKPAAPTGLTAIVN